MYVLTVYSAFNLETPKHSFKLFIYKTTQNSKENSEMSTFITVQSKVQVSTVY